MGSRTRRYAVSDTAQQLVGGFLLAGPFVVTEEVWVLARSMSVAQTLLTVAIVFVVGYGALYKADDDRDPDRESDVAGVPLRFVSLILVSYLSVFILAMAFDAPTTFVPRLGAPVVVGSVTVYPVVAAVTVKAVNVGAIFSVIGAATADSIY
ncbi:MAG: DUF2391 family protein [Haloferacaceae archaeon]